MAQIPFSLRELVRAWRSLHTASGQLPEGNAHRLLLIYAVECGLKAVWLKQQGRTLFGTADIARTGHDLNELLKSLHLPPRLHPVFNLPDVKDERRNAIPRKNNRIDALHQAWRYGGELCASPVDDAAMQVQLQAVYRLIEKELKS